MAAQLLRYPNVWARITKAAKAQPRNAAVAVAYFGRGASRLLPLGRGSRLVVDASEPALRAGLTHPDDLAALVKRGVRVSSERNLHAKMFALGPVAFVGSANASRNSATVLKEAVVETTDRRIVADVRRIVLAIGGASLGLERLAQMQRIYRPPRVTRRAASAARSRSAAADAWRIVKLVSAEPPEAAVAVERSAEDAARKILSGRRHSQSHTIDDFHWPGNISVRRGATVVMVHRDEGGVVRVWPPGEVIVRRTWIRGNRRVVFIWLELPRDKPRKLSSIRHRLTRGAYKRLSGRGGWLADKAVQAEIGSLFK